MEFENKDVLDSKSATSAIFDSFYPNGELVIKNTTQSLAGPSLGRTLTSRSLSEAMSGEALFRSPKFSNVFYNKTLSSSLTSSLTAGSETAFSAGQNYEIVDPEGTSASAKLTGGAAFASVISNSIAGTNAGADFVDSASRSIENDFSTKNSYPSTNSVSTSGNGGSSNGTGNNGINTTSNGEILSDLTGAGVSGGVRYIVFQDELTADEKTWLNERSNLIGTSGAIGDSSYVMDGFHFNVPDDLTEVKLTFSHYPGSINETLPQNIVQMQQKWARVCPSIIEMMIALNGMIHIKGGVGSGRGLRDGMAATNGNVLSDHALGRAIDLSEVGLINQPIKSFSRANATYQEGLTVLLEALNVLPIHLIPDVIVISENCKSELGITDSRGLEGEDTLVKQMYPNLRWVNFGFDANHNDHVHISFTTSRSGIYTGPGGQMNGVDPTVNAVLTSVGGDYSGPNSRTGPGTYIDYIKNISINQYIKDIRSIDPFGRAGESGGGGDAGGGAPVLGSAGLPTELSDPKFTKDYSITPDESLTVEDIFSLLRLTVACDEIAAVIASISERESGFQPAGLYIKRGSDWSIGLFQTSMRPSAHGKKNFYLPIGEVNSVGWQLAYKDFSADGVTVDNFETVAFDKADEYAIAMFFSGPEYASKTFEEKKALLTSGKRTKAMRSRVDSSCWVPLNQAYMTYVTATSVPFTTGAVKMGGPGCGYVLGPWGDYGGGPEYGWMENVKWSTASRLYSAIGKDPADLKKYLIDMYEATGATGSLFRSRTNIDRWTDGYFFPSNAEPYLEVV